MGLWLLQESVREWERDGGKVDFAALLAAAAELPRGGSVINVGESEFLPPGDMPARIAARCKGTDQPVPASRPAFARCILDSLAGAFARTIADVRLISGRDISVIHIIGGGSRERAFVPAHCRRVRTTRPSRPGRGHGTRQRPGTGSGARIGSGRSRRTSFGSSRHAATASVRAGNPRADIGGLIRRGAATTPTAGRRP